MSAGLTIAAVIFSSITAPLVINYLTQRSRREEKKEDWARQDEVAKRAEEAAAAMGKAALEASTAAQQAKVATQQAAEDLIAANERVRKETRRAAEIVNGKLDQIHTLVNSNLSEAMNDRLTAINALIVALRNASDQSPAALQRIKGLETTAIELEAQLADRRRQTAVADAQVEQGEAGGLRAEWADPSGES